MKAIKLSTWAKENGYSYRGAYVMFQRGDLPNAYQLASGAIMVNNIPFMNKPQYTVIYCRVSTTKQKSDLERQLEVVTKFCISNGWVIDKTYKEIASGLNDNRKQLNALLENTNITRVVISHKDRLTRFGFNYIKKFLESRNCELVVINRTDDGETDLVQDFVSVITSMAARVYGLRRHKPIVEKILTNIDNERNN